MPITAIKCKQICMNRHNEYIVIKTGARFSEQAVLMSAWSAILIMIVWTVIDMFLDLAALQQTATFQPLKKTTTTRRTPSQATTQVRCDLIIKSQHHKSTRVHQHQYQKQQDQLLCRRSETWMDTRGEKLAVRLNTKRRKRR